VCVSVNMPSVQGYTTVASVLLEQYMRRQVGIMCTSLIWPTAVAEFLQGSIIGFPVNYRHYVSQ